MVHDSRILIVTGLAGKILAVVVETRLDVLHDLHLQLLCKVELSEYLLLPPNWSGPLLVVKLMLGSSRLETLDPHVVQPDHLNGVCPLHLNDKVIHLLHFLCPVHEGGRWCPCSHPGFRWAYMMVQNAA